MAEINRVMTAIQSAIDHNDGVGWVDAFKKFVNTTKYKNSSRVFALMKNFFLVFSPIDRKESKQQIEHLLRQLHLVDAFLKANIVRWPAYRKFFRVYAKATCRDMLLPIRKKVCRKLWCYSFKYENKENDELIGRVLHAVSAEVPNFDDCRSFDSRDSSMSPREIMSPQLQNIFSEQKNMTPKRLERLSSMRLDKGYEASMRLHGIRLLEKKDVEKQKVFFPYLK